MKTTTFFATVAGLAFAASANAQGTLFFSEDGNENGLYELDLNNGSATNLGESGVIVGTVGLAPSENLDELFGTDPIDLVRINTDGSGFSAIDNGVLQEGLAYDRDNDQLYGAINGNFSAIDKNTGNLTTLAAPGDDVEGLAYAGNGSIFGLGISDNLRSYDIDSNTWSVIGDTGVHFNAIGLAYGNGVLYAKGNRSSMLYQIDPNTANATVIGDTGIANGGGLAFVIPAPGSAALLGVAGLAAARRRR